MQHIDQPGRPAIVVGQTQLVVVASFREIPGSVLGFLLLNQPGFACAETQRTVKFNVLSIRKDDGLPGIDLCGLVNKPPKNIKPAGGIDGADLSSGLAK